ncbi:MAG: dihydropteroate synthase [bacterium]
MLVIGERINVRTNIIRDAMQQRDFGPIKDFAEKQVKAGANILDVNIGPARKDGPDLMTWMVKNLQEAVDVPLCLDTTNVDAMEAGLRVCNKKAMINSTSAEPERLAAFMPLAQKYNCDIIALTLAKGGLPRDGAERCALAADIMAAAAEYNVPLENIYLDPIMIPINGQQEQVPAIFESIQMFKELNDPPMKSVIGLSNISNGCPEHLRPLINSVFAAMAMTVGLDAAIIDPLDEMMMKTIRTVDCIQNKTLYCHSYLE